MINVNFQQFHTHDTTGFLFHISVYIYVHIYIYNKLKCYNVAKINTKHQFFLNFVFYTSCIGVCLQFNNYCIKIATFVSKLLLTFIYCICNLVGWLVGIFFFCLLYTTAFLFNCLKSK